MGERIDGTILIDLGHAVADHAYALAAFNPEITVTVNHGAEIDYAVIGEPGRRTWWFAGIGTTEEVR